MDNGLQTQTWIEPLSHREIEILRLITDGLSNYEISQELVLSLETIKWYNKQIFAKLGVKSRTQAARKAVEYGLYNSQGEERIEGERSQYSNLPAQLTSFVGRVREIAEIKGLLKSSRLVVLTGAGGCGKSRLAAQVAAELVEVYPDGVWLVEFASISDPALVVNAIVRTLQINASGNDSLTDVLKRFLARKHLLLLLDNFEHLQEASPLVAELLASAPLVTVLATSRERLHLYGEQEYPVHPLSLPDLQNRKSKEQWLAYEAIDLFIQRAQATQPGFTVDEDKISSIASICVRLDGLPLAIELAASQVKIFPPAILAQRLEEGLDALPSGPRDLPSRQRTLRATIEWSYNLLDDYEKTLFARLSIFRGGSTLEGITRVCGHGLPDNGSETLSPLVEKNLVYPRQISEGELRFTMLETIHQYAAEYLDASWEAGNIRILHAGYFANLAETAQKEIYTARQEYWFGRLLDELDNLRSVLAWSLNGDKSEHGLRLAAALDTFWIYNGLAAEGRRWTDLALIKSTQVEPELRAGVLRSAGHIASYMNDMPRSKKLLRQAVELYQQNRDELNAAWALVYFGLASMENPKEVQQGINLCTQVLAQFRNLDDKPGLAFTLNVLGELARIQNDYKAAQRYYEDSLSLVEETGERQREAMLFNNLSFVAYQQQNYRLALELSQKALRLAHQLKNDFRQSCFIATVAGPTAALGDPERAARLLAASYARFEALGFNHAAVDQKEFKLYEAATRNQLGDEEFLEAWQSGLTMTLREAVPLALNEFDLGE
jgi:predicted ATPase/DNA-binding CsgD family transcriptional regulator